MTYIDDLQEIEQMRAGLKVKLQGDVGGKIQALSELLDGLPDELTLNKVDDEQKDELKKIKTSWSKVKKGLDALLGAGTGKRVGGTKKVSTATGRAPNVNKKQKQEAVKSFIDGHRGVFTRSDIEESLNEEFKRTVQPTFYTAILEDLVERGILRSENEDKDNSKSALNYSLVEGQEVGFAVEG